MHARLPTKTERLEKFEGILEVFHPDSLRIGLANLKVDTKVGLCQTAKFKNFL